MTVDAPPRARLAYGTLQLARADQAGPIVFTASTERLNRYNFVLNHDHWRLGNYHANPVVILNHRADELPIGRAAATLDGFTRTLRAAVTFDSADPRAAEVEGKVRRRMMSAMSAGFDFQNADGSPIADWFRLSPQQIYDDAFYDLAELSLVTVPADPGAVRAEQSAGAGVGLSADGCAMLLGAVRLGPGSVEAVVRRLLPEVLAERAAHRDAVLACFPSGPYVPPHVW